MIAGPDFRDPVRRLEASVAMAAVVVLAFSVVYGAGREAGIGTAGDRSD